MFNVTQLLCTRCHHIGYAKNKTQGSFIGEVAVWILFFVIGLFSSLLLLIIPLIYTFYRAFSTLKVCEACGSTELIPTDSPRAIEITKSKLNDEKQS